MKKIISLFFVILTFTVTSNSFAQSVTLKMKRPPLNQLKAADLWSATITNSGEAFTAYLYGSMTNNENSELIATGQTVTFEVKRGTTNFKVSDLPSVPDINYLSKDPKYKQSFMNTGGAPPGDYKICVQMRFTDNTVAGEDCFDQKIAGGDAPQLISPRNDEELNNDNPIFTWMHFKAGSDQTYTLRIVELKGNESPENAMLKNKAFFEKEGITMQMLQYPSTAPKLEEGKKYAWQVSVYQNGVSLLKSSVNYFTNKVSSDKKITPTLTTTSNDCDFFDEYFDDDPWRPIAKGNVIGIGPYDIAGCNPRSSTISSSSYIQVNGGQCVFQNVTEEGNDYRTFREFAGAFKTNFESSNCWEAKFEFKYTQLGADNRVGHPIFALTAGKWNPINYSDETSVVQSAFCNFSDQDAMMLWLWLPTTAFYNAHPEISPVPAVGTRKAAFFPWCKNGKNLDGYIPTTKPIDAEANTTYYIKLERINATKGRINVYSDLNYTIHVTNSPQCFDIPNGEQITGLNTLQHSNAPDGVGRELTGALDNTCIKILDPGSISCGTTTPPSNCNSDCKLITANATIAQGSNLVLSAYVGKYKHEISPTFTLSNPNILGENAWNTVPDVSKFFSPEIGKEYLIKGTGGYPDQWGRVYDAAFQFGGTWESGTVPNCQGYSQFMLSGCGLGKNTRPNYPIPSIPNSNYHEYLYEFTGNVNQIAYNNTNNIGGGSGNIQAKYTFYELCNPSDYTYEWNPVQGNPSGGNLTNTNTRTPTFSSNIPNIYKYEVKLFCSGIQIDVDTTEICVLDITEALTDKRRTPECGCRIWGQNLVSLDNGTNWFNFPNLEIRNVASSSQSTIKFKPKYNFYSEGGTSCNNKLQYWIYRKKLITDSWTQVGTYPLNNNTISSFTINPITEPGWKYYWVRINPQGPYPENQNFPCPETSFLIQVVP